MSEKLPDGWFKPFPGDLWRHSTGAAADLHLPPGNFRAAVYGPDRTTKEEAEQDRLNLIAGLEGDTAPQLLRDSMRVTQEESARLKADMARKDAEIAALRQRVAASEAYAQHLLAALNLRTLP